MTIGVVHVSPPLFLSLSLFLFISSVLCLQWYLTSYEDRKLGRLFVDTGSPRIPGEALNIRLPQRDIRDSISKSASLKPSLLPSFLPLSSLSLSLCLSHSLRVCMYLHISLFLSSCNRNGFAIVLSDLS